MASFEQAIPIILKHEGGYVNNPNDPGGATNYGVSLRYLLQTQDLMLGDIDHDGDIDIDDIRKMTVEDAKKIYHAKFWHPLFDTISDQDIATKCFDMAVNMGPVQATKLLQRALVACAKNVLVDGKLGALTVGCINSCDPKDLLFHIRDQQAEFYRGLVSRNSKFQVFLKGWLQRAYS